MNHRQYIEELQEFVDVKIAPIDTLAQITLVYIKQTGLELTAAAKLQQGFTGFGGGEKLGGEYAFALLYSGGKRKVSMRTGEVWMLVVEELNPATDEVDKVRMSASLSDDDPDSLFATLKDQFSADAVAGIATIQ